MELSPGSSCLVSSLLIDYSNGISAVEKKDREGHERQFDDDATAETKCHQCGDVCSYFNWVTCQKGLLDNGERPWNVSNNEYSQVVGYLLTKILATGWL